MRTFDAIDSSCVVEDTKDTKNAKNTKDAQEPKDTRERFDKKMYNDPASILLFDMMCELLHRSPLKW